MMLLLRSPVHFLPIHDRKINFHLGLTGKIKNRRTKEIPGIDRVKGASYPAALEVRDDRIHFFVDAGNMKQTYYCAVCAVSPGQYKRGPVSADARYNAEYHSYNGAGVIRVVQ
jgi:uncharacterized protein YfaS (alpha-2-macroglobulin family)